MAQLDYALSPTTILLSTSALHHSLSSRSSSLPTPIFHFPSSHFSCTALGFLHLKVVEHEWRRRTTLCRSNAKILCLGADDQAREAARKALESALGGKKELFSKWDEEIKKRESESAGGGPGGRGGGGSLQQDGNSWEEAKQIFFAFMGLAVFYLLITQGRSILAFTVNGILFALRGFKRYSNSTTKTPTLQKVIPQGSGSAESHVISKWGRE